MRSEDAGYISRPKSMEKGAECFRERRGSRKQSKQAVECRKTWRLGSEGHGSCSDTDRDFVQWNAMLGFLSPSSVASASLVDCAKGFL